MFWIEFLDTDKQTLFLWWKDTQDQCEPIHCSFYTVKYILIRIFTF